MKKILSKCPACGQQLRISALHCPDCGLELRNDFELNPFDALLPEQMELLMAFLQQKGNLSAVQQQLGISYPTAKKRLDALLVALHLAEEQQPEKSELEDRAMMEAWETEKDRIKDSVKASDIIKRKLMENNGKAVVYTAQNLPCEICAAPDGISFISNKLPVKTPYRYQVFDTIVDLLVAQNGRARKGNARNYKLGESGCDETTVVGAIGYHYFEKKTGDSVYDPVFVLAAVLEWADIAQNGRGELSLTAKYRALLGSSQGK